MCVLRLEMTGIRVKGINCVKSTAGLLSKLRRHRPLNS
jgi:hypothetical protein